MQVDGDTKKNTNTHTHTHTHAAKNTHTYALLVFLSDEEEFNDGNRQQDGHIQLNSFVTYPGIHWEEIDTTWHLSTSFGLVATPRTNKNSQLNPQWRWARTISRIGGFEFRVLRLFLT